MEIVQEGPSAPDVRELLLEHLADMRGTSPAESMHALDATGLAAPGVTFWAARDGDVLLGCGALKELGGTGAEAAGGEIKSMRTTHAARRRGVAARLLTHILGVARERGYRRIYLETGSQEFFEPARALYRAHGFTGCAPFADYLPDDNSVFMVLELA